MVEVPSVMLPPSGISYNPSMEAHTNLLQNLVETDHRNTEGSKNKVARKVDFNKRIAKEKTVKAVSKKEEAYFKEVEGHK